jgi:hypothetical protein
MKKWLITLLLAITAVNITYAQKTPIEFNDKIADVTDSLNTYGREWGSNFNAAYQGKDWNILKPGRIKLEKFITKATAQLQSMKDVKNSKPLRMAMISFLSYESRMTKEALLMFEAFNASSSDESIKAAIDKLQQFANNENEELQKVAAAQTKYASENGFSIEAPAKE